MYPRSSCTSPVMEIFSGKLDLIVIVLTFTHCFICTVTEIRILVMRGCFEVTRVENESFASLERPLGLERLAMFIFHPSDLKTTSNTRIHFRHSTNETMSGGQYFF